MSIPKTIHYCWFGENPLPESAIRCIKSWEKNCPTYVIRKWTEKDLDVNINLYTKQAYEAKCWGFVPDFLRLWIVYNFGGIYLDTDVQVLRCLDPLLEDHAFAGMETMDYVALGLGFGAERHNKVIEAHMDWYKSLRFIYEDGTLNKTPSPHYTTQFLSDLGFTPNINKIQRLDDITIYPPEYFCPKDFKTGITRLTRNTYSIHQFDASWYTDEEQKYKYDRWKREKDHYLQHTPNRIIRKVLGEKNYSALKHFVGKDKK